MMMPAVLLLVMGEFGFANSTFGDADFGWFGTVIGVSVMGPTLLGVILCVAVAVVLVAAASVWQRKVVDGGWVPGAKRDAYLAEQSAQASATK